MSTSHCHRWKCATAHAETQALDHLGNRTCNKGKEYIQKCDPQVQAVLGAKRLLLVERVAESINWPDTTLFQEMSQGFQLVGQATKSYVFQSGIKAASMSEEQLMKDAKF